MKKYYLAYGSNLNVQQMKFRCPGAKVVGKSVIKNYELLYKGSKTGSYLTIEKKNGSVVPVVLPISPALCRPFRVMCMPSEGILFSSIYT